jgi:hypothetical protein
MLLLVNARSLFLPVALLFLANGAFADEGTYQRTKDGKTLVWNNYPLPGETAEWSGQQDREGYASGYGTVTWYKMARSNFTFSKPHSVESGRFSGKMVKGKLEGDVVREDPVSTIRWNANVKTFHANFVGGNRVGDWVTGPARRASKLATAPDQPGNENPELGATAKAPPQEPVPSPVPPQSPKQTVSAPTKETAPPVSDSLRSVAAPPSSLQTDRPVNATPPSSLQTDRPVNPSPEPTLAPAPATFLSSTDHPQLTTREVIELADSVARENNIDLSKYQNPQAQYVAEDDTWSVAYDQKLSGGTPEPGRDFIVSVGDKTKKTSIGPGKY